MPIHTSWKSMAEGMRSVKAYNQGKIKCRPFTDGSKVCMRTRAWSVFFATINKMGADETKPRPQKVKTSESMEKVIKWFMESKGITDENIPNWVPLAKKVLNSPKFTEKIKVFWKKKLDAYCAKNPKSGVCK
jgi:hypothetical protein